MKKIALVLISVLLLAFLAGCNGEVDNLLWDEEEEMSKTITLIIYDSPSDGSFDSEDPYKYSIEFTVPYETWEDWRFDGRTINIYNTATTNSVWSVANYDGLHFIDGTEEWGYVVWDSNHNYVSRNDSIANEGTYYLFLIPLQA